MASDDAEKLGNLEGKMKCIHDLSWYVYNVSGRYDEALVKSQYVLKYSKDIGDRYKQSVVLNNTGLIYQNRGDYDAALDKYNESLEIKRQLGDKIVIANSLNNIGSLLICRGKYEEALPHILQAHNILQSLHIPVGDVLNNLSSIKNALGEEKYQNLVSNANRQ
jgi:tetratricopeptide (TPR) repeat protein